MKKLTFAIPVQMRKAETVERVTFYVVDDKAKLEASRILSKVKYPTAPSLHGLEKAYRNANAIRKRMEDTRIEIVQRKTLTKEEAYEKNVSAFHYLVEQRDAMIDIIDVVRPVIENVVDVNVELSHHRERISELECRIEELIELLNRVYGESPKKPLLKNGKELWCGTLREAALEIIKLYEIDNKAEVKQYRSLRNASDEYCDRHKFLHKPDLTKDMLYENVKKA
jgi:hypothetical protein